MGARNMRDDVRGILPTARPELLSVFLTSWFNPAVMTRDIPITVSCHGANSAHFAEVLADYSREEVFVDSYYHEYRPVYPDRVSMMQEFPDVRTFINLDDDMEVIPEHTDYEPAIRRSRVFGVGVVSCGWAKSEALLPKALQGTADPWIKQPIVNMAGGQVYGQHVVREMAKRIEPYQFDDVEAALRAYVAGYENWRFRGSIIFHRIMKPGGLKEAFARVSHSPNEPEFMRMDAAKPVPGRESVPENNRLMPSSINLTPLAHACHKAGRHALGFR